ncbi:LOW QUALITY PROTEIN: hypothetical protein QTO34_015155 [Cnephaeus nilssonii]|uniref:AAA+ ATPase domain-containing protein n=1 Tax=Cnephaeus nilssonii TaxID=3371016 RepID=A0AA40LQY8_CNENI|nr:LOW QUALITY PROTEIN: hypothetical protein QTO34_015155 [Eptesicus nilssonii]
MTFGWTTKSRKLRNLEFPFTHPEYYEDLGLKPPSGVILYGPPGTGKTLLAKAVANQISATFLSVVGSELIQKYAMGLNSFRNCFELLNASSTVFIDEIDAIGTKSYDSNSSAYSVGIVGTVGELGGLDLRGDVKVFMAINQIETFDPALIRPGHVDRKIEFPCPVERTISASLP